MFSTIGTSNWRKYQKLLLLSSGIHHRTFEKLFKFVFEKFGFFIGFMVLKILFGFKQKFCFILIHWKLDFQQWFDISLCNSAFAIGISYYCKLNTCNFISLL